tara:strand:- start:16 stop:1281 length:1266 start_codon:yes stop_codon:yes gene_type:complete
MAIVQGRTRAQIRQSIGHNLGALRTGSAYDAGSQTTLISLTLIGGDDNYNGKWIVVNDASNSSNIETTIISDYTASAYRLTFQQQLSFATAAGDTYEIWDSEYRPETIDEFINQAILDTTGHAFDPVESLALHSDGSTQRFDIPSGISMIQNVHYRSSVDFTRLLSCNTAMDETVDSNFTITADTKIKKQGTASNKIVITGSASAGDLATDSITSKDISQYDYIEFWIRSTVATSAGNLKILLDDSASCASPVEELSVPALSADTWTFCRVALSNPESDTAIISVGLEYDSDLGACTVWLDDISAVDHDSADWVKTPRNLWKIDKEAKDIIFDSYFHGTARYNLLKIVGGDKPALMTADTATSEIDEQYIIARATALAFAATSGGANTDPDDRNNMAGFWMGMSQQAKRQIPFLTDVRLVE